MLAAAGRRRRQSALEALEGLAASLKTKRACASEQARRLEATASRGAGRQELKADDAIFRCGRRDRARRAAAFPAILLCNGRAGSPYETATSRRIRALRGARGAARPADAALHDRTGYFLQSARRFYACHANGVRRFHDGSNRARARAVQRQRDVVRRGASGVAGLPSNRHCSGPGGASTSRLPLTLIDETSPAASICSTSRAARL
jgi:hypothetical protein